MERLIDADEAYKVLTDYYNQRTEIQHKALKEALSRVPTVDIDAITESHERIGYDRGFRDGYAQATSEVRHGHWVVTPYTDYDDTYECSVCGACWTFIEGTPKDNEAFYCPHCGARMEAEDVQESD